MVRKPFFFSFKNLSFTLGLSEGIAQFDFYIEVSKQFININSLKNMHLNGNFRVYSCLYYNMLILVIKVQKLFFRRSPAILLESRVTKRRRVFSVS